MLYRWPVFYGRRECVRVSNRGRGELEGAGGKGVALSPLCLQLECPTSTISVLRFFPTRPSSSEPASAFPEDGIEEWVDLARLKQAKCKIGCERREGPGGLTLPGLLPGHATPETEGKAKGAISPDVVVAKGVGVVERLDAKAEALLVWGYV